MDILISNQFSTWGSGQTENLQICIFGYFLFDHFLKSKIDFKSRVIIRKVHKVSNIQCENNFLISLIENLSRESYGKKYPSAEGNIEQVFF